MRRIIPHTNLTVRTFYFETTRVTIAASATVAVDAVPPCTIHKTLHDVATTHN